MTKITLAAQEQVSNARKQRLRAAFSSRKCKFQLWTRELPQGAAPLLREIQLLFHPSRTVSTGHGAELTIL